MKGYKYAYFSTEGGRRTHRHALWVPAAKILFQWVPLSPVRQVMECESFPPPGADATELDELDVSKEVIAEARHYLEQQAHLDAQERSVATALQRIRGRRMVNENRAQKTFRAINLQPAD